MYCHLTKVHKIAYKLIKLLIKAMKGAPILCFTLDSTLHNTKPQTLVLITICWESLICKTIIKYDHHDEILLKEDE